jgi:hypothetical protein
VPLSIEPSVQLASQLALKKQARSDALNEYFQNSQKDINPDGIRSQDQPGFINKYKDFTNFYSQNRNAIQNPQLDGGKAASEFNARHQDMLAYAQGSKNDQAIHQEAWKAKLNPATSYMFNTPDAMSAIQAHELPRDDPNHKSLDLDQMKVNAQPMGVKEMSDLQNYLTKGMVRKTRVGTPQRDGSGTAWQQMGYDPVDQQALLTRAQTAYAQNQKLQTRAHQIVDDPTRYSQAAAAFTKISGRAPQNEAEIFAGEQAAMANLDQTESVKVPDFQTRSNITEGRQKRMADYTYGQKVNLDQWTSDLSLNKSRQLNQDDYDKLSDRYDTLTSGPTATGQKGKVVTDDDGKPVTEYTLQGMGAFDKGLNRGTPANPDYPTEYRTGTGKDYVRVMYADGTSKKIDKPSFIGMIAKQAPLKSVKPVTPPPAGATPKKLAPGALD